MNITRSTRKSKIKNLAKLGAVRKKLTLSIVSILSCISILFVGGVASTVDPNVEIDNPITYTSDIAFEKNPEGVEFYIRTYQDLQVLANLVSANAVITGTNISYSTATYTVLNNITNENGSTMNPIGSSSSPFKEHSMVMDIQFLVLRYLEQITLVSLVQPITQPFQD